MSAYLAAICIVLFRFAAIVTGILFWFVEAVFWRVAPAPVLNSNLPLEISCNVRACFAKRKMFLYWGNKYVITGPSFILLVIADKLDIIVQQSKSISANDSP